MAEKFWLGWSEDFPQYQCQGALLWLWVDYNYNLAEGFNLLSSEKLSESQRFRQDMWYMHFAWNSYVVVQMFCTPVHLYRQTDSSSC
jgi:hypothetical protein